MFYVHFLFVRFPFFICSTFILLVQTHFCGRQTSDKVERQTLIDVKYVLFRFFQASFSIFLIFFFICSTRPNPAYGRQGLVPLMKKICPIFILLVQTHFCGWQTSDKVERQTLISAKCSRKVSNHLPLKYIESKIKYVKAR